MCLMKSGTLLQGMQSLSIGVSDEEWEGFAGVRSLSMGVFDEEWEGFVADAV